MTTSPFIECGTTTWGNDPCVLRQGHDQPDADPRLAHVSEEDLRLQEADERGFDPSTIAEARHAIRVRKERQRWANYVGSRLGGADMDNVDQPAEILQVVRSWIESKSPDCLIAYGPVGGGKTYLGSAACFARRLRHAEHVIAISASEYLAGLRPDGDPSRSLEALKADVVLLDDLGAEKPSPWTDEQMFRLFDARWKHERATFVTTNLPPEELKKVLGERSFDRLRDGVTVLRIGGVSRRKARAA